MSTKHVVVREYLRGLVDDELGPGDRIPSERDLCQRFGVSRMTVRQAVDALVVDGVLDRVQGRGTFVAQHKVDMQLRLTAFDDEMRRRGMEPSSRVLRAATMPAPRDVAAALELEPGAEVVYLRRVRLADGAPMALEENWCPRALLPGTSANAFTGTPATGLAGTTVDGAQSDGSLDEPPPSVFAALTAAGYPPSWGEDTIEAVSLSPAEAQLLGTRPGAAAMRITRRTFSVDVPVDFSRALYRGDRYALWAPVSPPRPTLVPPAGSARSRPRRPRSATTPSEGAR